MRIFYTINTVMTWEKCMALGLPQATIAVAASMRYIWLSDALRNSGAFNVWKFSGEMDLWCIYIYMHMYTHTYKNVYVYI